jgi:hypothetical protein
MRDASARFVRSRLTTRGWAPKLATELPDAGVEGVDEPGAASYQDGREPAGGGPEIEADDILHGYPEPVDSGSELDTSAQRRRGTKDDPGIGPHVRVRIEDHDAADLQSSVLDRCYRISDVGS